LKPRVIYYRVLKYQPENVDLLHAKFDVVTSDDPRRDSDEVLATADAIFAPLGFRVDKSRLDRCPKLRAIISNTTSIPHIDAAEAERRGIKICALHDEQEFLGTITPTAEHTIGLMMALWRRIPAAHAAACRGEWDRRPWGAPRMLSRMRLGIVGYGRLGQRVAPIAEAIGMKVQFYDPHKIDSCASLLELAARSDVLSLHAPANPETTGLISREVLAALPRGAILINTARGELLDADAMLDLLKSGHLAGAALDTIDGEYDSGFDEVFAKSALRDYAASHDNLILTPHIGGSTIDAWRETERRAIEKAAAVFDAAP
jgi:phosphoglycerate dehydrogenase-like enzyme